MTRSGTRKIPPTPYSAPTARALMSHGSRSATTHRWKAAAAQGRGTGAGDFGAKAADRQRLCGHHRTGQGIAGYFERTYGTVKRWEFIPPKAPRRPIADTSEEKRRELKRAFSGEEYLLVDGYNIIFAWDELKKIAAENLDAARQAALRAAVQLSGLSEVPGHSGI